ncbi:hypothetical protein CEUSTIGMA_g913.t1 [Chlamydomonas eustigma]|uniref:F-box domain-containing protein n=1 Tax=Chlamydomonas eustigma TaxID=1157962 RepID=A0A250WRP0_9CHLO|nr:hypothetical protein CEUSTIGMA_g913.t1 [Chlamydomonas eustigma]|eukprot:GAX73461.1 hypothetical protein CEUSTIGMA_g913.t1 [Chlamydomonas eustigma]
MLDTLPSSLLEKIAQCAGDGMTLVSLQMACRHFHFALSNDVMWEKLCASLGYKQLTATRTRGKRPWREIYKSNICCECRNMESKGIVRIDPFGGSRYLRGSHDLLTLCVDCVQNVQQYSTMTERKRHCLPRLKSISNLWFTVLDKIPRLDAKRLKIAPGEEGADHNDHLLNAVIRKHRASTRGM